MKTTKEEYQAIASAIENNNERELGNLLQGSDDRRRYAMLQLCLQESGISCLRVLLDAWPQERRKENCDKIISKLSKQKGLRKFAVYLDFLAKIGSLTDVEKQTILEIGSEIYPKLIDAIKADQVELLSIIISLQKLGIRVQAIFPRNQDIALLHTALIQKKEVWVRVLIKVVSFDSLLQTPSLQIEELQYCLEVLSKHQIKPCDIGMNHEKIMPYREALLWKMTKQLGEKKSIQLLEAILQWFEELPFSIDQQIRFGQAPNQVMVTMLEAAVLFGNEAIVERIIDLSGYVYRDGPVSYAPRARVEILRLIQRSPVLNLKAFFDCMVQRGYTLHDFWVTESSSIKEKEHQNNLAFSIQSKIRQAIRENSSPEFFRSMVNWWADFSDGFETRYITRKVRRGDQYVDDYPDIMKEAVFRGKYEWVRAFLNSPVDYFGAVYLRSGGQMTLLDYIFLYCPYCVPEIFLDFWHQCSKNTAFLQGGEDSLSLGVKELKAVNESVQRAARDNNEDYLNKVYALSIEDIMPHPDTSDS